MVLNNVSVITNVFTIKKKTHTIIVYKLASAEKEKKEA